MPVMTLVLFLAVLPRQLTLVNLSAGNRNNARRQLLKLFKRRFFWLRLAWAAFAHSSNVSSAMLLGQYEDLFDRGQPVFVNKGCKKFMEGAQ